MAQSFSLRIAGAGSSLPLPHPARAAAARPGSDSLARVEASSGRAANASDQKRADIA